MRNILIKGLIILTGLTILASPAMADKHDSKAKKAPPGGAVAAAVSIDATVEAIDLASRRVTLRDDDGNSKIITVGQAARNLDQVQVGDRVNITYLEALVVDVRKASTELEASVETEIERTPKGEKPSGVVSQTTTLVAEVTAINHKDRLITLKGPEGNEMEFKVGKEAKRFHEIKKGERVAISYTEAVAISVTKGE